MKFLNKHRVERLKAFSDEDVEELVAEIKEKVDRDLPLGDRVRKKLVRRQYRREKRIEVLLKKEIEKCIKKKFRNSMKKYCNQNISLSEKK